jgi:short-subunit dehydrogenase
MMPTSTEIAAFRAKRVLVCGASGNLGGHVARRLALCGVNLVLWGRNAAALEPVASDCQSAPNTTASTQNVDIAEVAAAIAVLRQADDLAPFDCAFFVSGAGDTREAGRRVESPELILKLGITNFVAPAALAAELGERMAARGTGRIVLVGSAAASHPLPFAAAYSSSKCGLSLFAESLRLATKPHGVYVTLASPGFFAAPTDNAHAYARPGEVRPERVAERIIRAAAAGKREVVTPRWFVGLRWLGQMLPRPLRDRLFQSLPTP